MRAISILALSVCALSGAQAAQTVSYVYDALGRLTDVQILTGPGSGVTQSYSYDAAGNRQQHSVTAPGQSAVTLTFMGAAIEEAKRAGIDMSLVETSLGYSMTSAPSNIRPRSN